MCEKCRETVTARLKMVLEHLEQARFDKCSSPRDWVRKEAHVHKSIHDLIRKPLAAWQRCISAQTKYIKEEGKALQAKQALIKKLEEGCRICSPPTPDGEASPCEKCDIKQQLKHLRSS